MFVLLFLKNVVKECTGGAAQRKIAEHVPKTPSQFIVSPLDCANFGKGRRRSLSARDIFTF